MLTKTVGGYIKRIAADEYDSQHRGGRGLRGLTMRDDDYVENIFTCSSHDYVLLFSNLGRLYRIKAYEIPEGSRTARGVNLVNVVPLMPDEKIINILPVGDDLTDESFVCMITRLGTIKRTALSAFKNVRKTGIIAINIHDDDELTFVRKTTGSDSLIVGTKNGMAIHFAETEVREMGRTAAGVRAIRLKEGDEVIGMTTCKEDGKIITVTDSGIGRISPVSQYRLQSRWR